MVPRWLDPVVTASHLLGCDHVSAHLDHSLEIAHLGFKHVVSLNRRRWQLHRSLRLRYGRRDVTAQDYLGKTRRGSFTPCRQWDTQLKHVDDALAELTAFDGIVKPKSPYSSAVSVVPAAAAVGCGRVLGRRSVLLDS